MAWIPKPMAAVPSARKAPAPTSATCFIVLPKPLLALEASSVALVKFLASPIMSTTICLAIRLGLGLQPIDPAQLDNGIEQVVDLYPVGGFPKGARLILRRTGRERDHLNLAGVRIVLELRHLQR